MQLLTDSVCPLKGSIAIAGAVVSWMRDKLGLLSSAAESETVASQVSDTGGVYFVPAFSGLLAPHWRDDARGVIIGLSGMCTLQIVSRCAWFIS